MKNLILIFAIFFVAGTKLYAQPYLNVVNNTSCKVYLDFYCIDPGGTTLTGTTGVLFPANSAYTYNAVTLYGSSLPFGSLWSYGRFGDDPGCSFVGAGGGCSSNALTLLISEGTVFPANPTGCYNVNNVSPCNTCPNSTVTVSTIFHPNGNCDLIFN
ncbi:MAG TPA: hypothetical protein VK167_12395 [Flavipsychrobacter sp.]|nr:hypothetical protein [Flavipsychrobacter sp.]